MKSLKGHLLVASPELLAPFFTRTVILLFEHSEQGAAGVILNRPTEATITSAAEQVLQETLDWDKPIHFGGPVPGPMTVLHAEPGLADDGLLEGVYSSVDAAKVEQILRTRPEPSLILANYAGWGPGQLEGELEEDSWLILPARSELVFWDGEEDLWEAVVREIQSRDLTHVLGLRHVPGDPRTN